MPAYEISRTLVKSQPEVWAELEQVERLAELLGDEAIKITRTEPESAIEWEGTTASGRIEIEASGWGTKVRLTTEATEVEPDPPEPVVETVVEPEPDPEPDPVVEVVVPEPEPAPVAEIVEPESVLETPKPSFWTKLKSMFNSNVELTEDQIFETVDLPAEPELKSELEAAEDTEYVRVLEPEVVVEPEPEPVAVVEPEPDPEPEPEPTPLPIDYEERMTALLDHLGSAHKRPFVNNG